MKTGKECIKNFFKFSFMQYKIISYVSRYRTGVNEETHETLSNNNLRNTFKRDKKQIQVI